MSAEDISNSHLHIHMKKVLKNMSQYLREKTKNNLTVDVKVQSLV